MGSDNGMAVQHQAIIWNDLRSNGKLPIFAADEVAYRDVYFPIGYVVKFHEKKT